MGGRAPRPDADRAEAIGLAAAALAASEDPSVAHRARRLLLGEDEDSRAMRELGAKVARSERARLILGRRGPDGRIAANPYRKWQGPHWTLHQLERLDYPAGDDSLLPLRDQVYDWLLEESHLRPPRSAALPGQEDRFRRCASQEGNAIIYSVRLGIADDRTREFARRLVAWQWPDGGWNCDKDPRARSSSVVETLIPLRALALAGRAWGWEAGLRAADRAAEWFLERRLFRSKRTGAEIRPSYGPPFGAIGHPIAFWDVLTALVAMAETGKIGDPRCSEALDILAAKRLADGGFPAEKRTAVTADALVTRGTWAEWGPYGKRTSNPLVTVDALYVLKSAGRRGPGPL